MTDRIDHTRTRALPEALILSGDGAIMSGIPGC